MKPTVEVKFNGGRPVLTIATHGYLWPKEAIEHAYDVIRLAVGILGDNADPAAMMISEQRDLIAHLQPVVEAALDWQEDPSEEADSAFHRALHAFEDRAEAGLKRKP